MNIPDVLPEIDNKWKRLYIVSGLLLILTAIIWIIISRTAGILYAQGYPTDPTTYLQLISKHQLLAIITWSLWILADFLLFAPTIALFIILRRYNQTLALLGMLFAMFFNVYDICVTELNSLTLVSLSHGYALAITEVARASFIAAATYGYYALPLQTVLSFATGTFGYLLWCIPMAKGIFKRWIAIYGGIVMIVALVGSAAPLSILTYLRFVSIYLYSRMCFMVCPSRITTVSFGKAASEKWNI